MSNKKSKNKILFLKILAISIIASLVCAGGIYGWGIISEYSKISNGSVENSEAIESGFSKSILQESAISSENTRNGFKSLSDKYEQQLYNLIKTSADNITEKKSSAGDWEISPMTVAGNLNQESIKKVIYAIRNDCPEIFWLSSQYGYSVSTTGSKTILRLRSFFSKTEKNKAVKALNNKINEIIRNLPANAANDYIKELYFHDYIIDNCKYVKNNTQNIYTAYGCLVEGKAVCEGYSKALQTLLNKSGIECLQVTGKKLDENIGHMWNMVKINGNWYHVDSTWNDGGELSRYDWFNLNDDIIKKDHLIYKQIKSSSKLNKNDNLYNFELPVCNSMIDNFFERNAVKISIFDNNLKNAAIRAIINAANSKTVTDKSKNIYFKINNSKLNFSSAESILLTNKNGAKIFSYIKEANKYSKNVFSDRSLNYNGKEIHGTLVVKLNFI